MIGVDDLAALASRRLWERLESGTVTVSPADVVALLKLQHEAGPGTVSDAKWQAALRETLWLARSRLGGEWEPFVADLRASGALSLLWGPPPPRGAARP